MDSDNMFYKIIEWIWIPIFIMILRLWQKISGIDSKQSLAEERYEHYRLQRVEDRTLQSEQRKEIHKRFDKHEEVIMGRLDKLEMLVKTGHK